jgi:hypothetical protein
VVGPQDTIREGHPFVADTPPGNNQEKNKPNCAKWKHAASPLSQGPFNPRSSTHADARFGAKVAV